MKLKAETKFYIEIGVDHKHAGMFCKVLFLLKIMKMAVA
jgi:hypothetical protein